MAEVEDAFKEIVSKRGICAFIVSKTQFEATKKAE
jgi:hypothetical protein